MENADVNVTLLKFAREMKTITEEFEEEVELLMNTQVMANIKKSEEEFAKGKYKKFNTIDELRKEVK